MTALKGRVAVITGASRGIGLGVAQEFLAKGMRLGLCARGSVPISASDDVICASVDVTDAEAVQDFAGVIEKRWGTIDIWINNAGILDPIGPLREIASSDYRKILDINLLGCFHGTQAYVRHLRRRDDGGVLINISSGAGKKAISGWSAYCASKAAVDMMTQVVALEEPKLRAFALAPGVVDTGMQQLIRSSSSEGFPLLDHFQQLKRDEAFNSTQMIADDILALAFDPSKAESSALLRVPICEQR